MLAVGEIVSCVGLLISFSILLYINASANQIINWMIQGQVCRDERMFSLITYYAHLVECSSGISLSSSQQNLNTIVS